MTPHFTSSTDGTRIAFSTMGDPAAPAVVLIHGWSQAGTCWQPTLDRLAHRFHLVTLDLRGHGASDKPEDPAAYTDTALWGDDIAAVIAAADLHRPTLVGWSYGSRVIAAHLATHGEGHLAGVVLAGGILAIGRAREDWMVGPASPGLDRDLYTDDLPRRLAATARFVEACTTDPLDRTTYAELVGVNMLCPAHARRALFAADLDLRPTYAAMTCPGLVIHGLSDRVVAPETGRVAASTMPDGRFLGYDGIGHAPFLEAPDRFVADLAAFVTSCQATA
ncbi:alpha/beta fold hydrolase [Roseicyclus mahoneyensis]|uniref:Pimeloyl-ACP methyl ester carboxylesterase n=1 Tax=Roseicyclus mahoneyensis TaxID=164332 RepID=A0A316GGS4_9RHOB|nr:alpha/beta hydrolase [Roseicyclus mahoneyensis]PWK60249.1 pimeloyl-ACP methyl ester carboxylesterase [Roseicyclus mahoneyensis]